MTKKQVKEYTSIEEFEREFLPLREEQESFEASGAIEQLAEEMTSDILKGIRSAMQRDTKK